MQGSLYLRIAETDLRVAAHQVDIVGRPAPFGIVVDSQPGRQPCGGYRPSNLLVARLQVVSLERRLRHCRVPRRRDRPCLKLKRQCSSCTAKAQ
ncbi:hypothetical protein D3C84_1055250 [compost metagenome]